jgi:DUF4097 and DUF4098 domain-containing protein YvlB
MNWIVSLIAAAAMFAVGLDLPCSADFNLQCKFKREAVEKSPLTFLDAPEKPFFQNVSDDETLERIDQTYQINPNGRISIRNTNGLIAIETWNKAEVRVEAVKTVDCEKPLQIDVLIDSNPSFLRIETRFPKNENAWVWRSSKDSKSWSSGYQNRCRQAKVEYKLTVPRTIRLDEAETINGDINLNGLIDFVKASTVNGKITATNLSGSLNLSAVNGTLAVDFDSLENVRDVRLGIVNGRIELQLPSDSDATLKASTVGGSISNDFNLSVRKGEYVGRNLYGQIGTGAVNVKLEGVNGAINIRRKQDKRTLKPVTDLLLAKNNADTDATNGTINDSINKAVNQVSSQAVLESLKEAEKNLAKVKINETEMLRALKKADREMRQFRFKFDFSDSQFAPLGESETKSIAVEGKPNLNVNANGGAVSIRGWDKTEISYTLAKESAEAVSAAINKNGTEITLDVSRKNDAVFRLEIFVPRKCDLRVRTDRAIRVENVSGSLNLLGADESIDVRDASGSLNAATADGRIRVIGFAGAGDFRANGGEILLEGDFDTLSSVTTDGAILLTLPETATAQIESFGRIRFDGLKAVRAASEKNIWRIGDKASSRRYFFKTSDAEIIIRNRDSIRVF